jgi:hypothetical protein
MTKVYSASEGIDVVAKLRSLAHSGVEIVRLVAAFRKRDEAFRSV